MCRESIGRIWIMRLVSLPFVAVAICAATQIMQAPLTMMFGHTVPARYESVGPHFRSPNGPFYESSFVARDDGAVQRGTAIIDSRDAPLPKPARRPSRACSAQMSSSTTTSARNRSAVGSAPACS
jgi:hypothetical protein